MNKTMLRRIIGSKIRSLRTSRKLSIEELAEYLELSPAFVGLIERGKRGTSVMNLVKISKLFNVSIDSLIYDTADEDSYKNISKYATINALMCDFTENEIKFFTETTRIYRLLRKNKE